MKTRIAVFIIVLGLIAVALPSQALAGRYKKKVVVTTNKKVVSSRHQKNNNVAVVRLPAGHKTVVVKNKSYYYHGGIFYKKGVSGFITISSPVGARITVLPSGFKKIYVKSTPYYYFSGTYYRYVSSEKVYVVVEKPTDVVEGDTVTLVDGEKLSGRFLGGNEETIDFEMNGDIYEIKVEDVVTISFD